MGAFYSNNTKLKKVQFIKGKSPSKQESEDALLMNDNLGIYGVMDGSTPVDSFKDEDGHNGAYLAANLFKHYLESLEKVDYLHHEVLQANQLLKHKMNRNDIDTANKSKLWCTCISAVQIKDDMLIYASLGDTMILTSDKRGHVNVLTVDSVKNISARARLTRDIDRYNGIDIPDEAHFQEQRNKVAYHRKMANTPNGYSIANGMEDTEQYIQYGMLNINDLKHVLLMSDGLFDPKGDLRSVYWEIKVHGLEGYAQKLSAYERDHSIHADDKTAVLLTF